MREGDGRGHSYVRMVLADPSDWCVRVCVCMSERDIERGRECVRERETRECLCERECVCERERDRRVCVGA